MTNMFNGFLDSISRSHARALSALFCLALLSFLPGFTALPPMDRDEPRFSQATRQMLETGDYVDIRFQNEARHKKPVGIYWLQAASVTAGEMLGVEDARHRIWLYRVPSLLGAILGVLLTYWVALAFVSRRGSLIAAALTAVCLIVTVEARLAKTDAVLFATIMASVGALARVWFAHTDPRTVPQPGLANALIFWVAMGVGVLVKGPITPLIAGLIALSLVVFERRAGWLMALRPRLGLVVLAVIVLPWFAAIIQKSGLSFFEEAIGRDMLGKVGSAQEKHGAPPGTYLAVFLATAWPLAPFLLLAVPFIRRAWRDDAVFFLIAWIVPAWLLFEAVPTKLPHYVLPLYPAMAILAAMALERGALEGRTWWQKALGLLVLLLPAGLLAGGPIVYELIEGTFPWVTTVFVATACAFAALSVLALWRDEAAAAVVPAIASALFLYAGAFQFGVPGLGTFTISPRLAAAAASVGCANPSYATVGYREPSLVLLTGTELEMLETGAAAGPALTARIAAFLGGPGCRIAFVEKQAEAGLAQALAEAGTSFSIVNRVVGNNVNSRNRRLDIGVWVKR